MALIEKRGFIRLVARLGWNLSAFGTECTVQSNGSPGLLRGATNGGHRWRGSPGSVVLYNTSGRNTGSSVTVSKAPEIHFFFGDTQCTPAPEPTAVEPFNVGHLLAGDSTGGTDPNVAYPGQISPEASRLRMDSWAKNVLRGATTGGITADSSFAASYSYCEFEGLEIRHNPNFNNHTVMLNSVAASMANELREGSAMYARVVPMGLASGGFQNFGLTLQGVLPAPAVRDIPVVFFRQDSSNVWNWYVEEDKVKAWQFAVAAMQNHIRMLQRIFEFVTSGGVATAHPEWAASGVRPEATTSVWLTAEQLTSCDEWWDQVVQLRAGLEASPSRTSVIDGAKGSENAVEHLDAQGFTQDGKSPAELFEAWKASGSSLPFLDWLKTPAGGSDSPDNGNGFLDVVADGAKWVGDNVVDIVKDWGATGTLGFLAGAKVITSDELPSWALPVGLGVLAFLVLK